MQNLVLSYRISVTRLMKRRKRHMAKVNDMKVTSHVGRDLLASAAAFKTEAAVIWEYVVNGLQYVDRGTIPRVSVQVRQSGHSIAISDNGRGMTDKDLQHYFTMHGE